MPGSMTDGNFNDARANERQVGGDHYKSEYQVWDFVMDMNLNYLQGNAVKYITRAHKKDGRKDLEKALHYLDKLIERRPSLVMYQGQSATIEKFKVANRLSPRQLDAVDAIVHGNYEAAKLSVKAI